MRGFSKALKHKELYRFLYENNVAVFALLETKLEEGKFFDIVTWNFKDWKVSHNLLLHNAGRIVLLWDPGKAQVDIIHMTS